MRKVLVCRPGLAHKRLTPTNADDLLFDDVMWVESAQHDLRTSSTSCARVVVEVVELHDLLGETMTNPEARSWLLDRKHAGNVSWGWVSWTTPGLSWSRCRPPSWPSSSSAGWPRTTCATSSGRHTSHWPGEQTGVREYLMPPLPNTLYTRDTTCWLYGGLTMNPLFWPARADETLIYKAIYTFHPDFVGSTDLVGGPRAVVGTGDLRRRRHHARRQRRRAHGHE